MATSSHTSGPAFTGELPALLAQATTSHGEKFQVPLLRVTRNTAVFEHYSLTAVLRSSEVLTPFQISLREQSIYDGPATVRSLVNDGVTTRCEVTLAETAWHDVNIAAEMLNHGGLQNQFAGFLAAWQQNYQVRPDIKIITTDLQTFLSQLRVWTDQVEFGLRTTPAAERSQRERQLAAELRPQVFPCLDELFDQLEQALARGCEEARPRHAAFIRRQLHPLLLGAPFAHRTVHKPLGYAGDYEVVNMILRDPHEGDSLYARVLNHWFIKQPPAEAHRNRVAYLSRKLLEESARVAAAGRGLQAYNLGCGPAGEIQQFLSTQAVSDAAHFTLVDFSEETLTYAADVLKGLCQRHARHTQMEFQKKSVAHLLRGKSLPGGAGAEAGYDLVYCAGLFDYLSDATCRRLVEVFYEMLAPGGLVLVTNVDSGNPIRRWLEDVLDWPLIYRDGPGLKALKPAAATEDETSVCADYTGVNLFLEIRKPTP